LIYVPCRKWHHCSTRPSSLCNRTLTETDLTIQGILALTLVTPIQYRLPTRRYWSRTRQGYRLVAGIMFSMRRHAILILNGVLQHINNIDNSLSESENDIWGTWSPPYSVSTWVPWVTLRLVGTPPYLETCWDPLRPLEGVGWVACN
jgi:hypothetical protein